MLLFLKRLFGYRVRWTFQEHRLSQLQGKKSCLSFLRVEAKWFAMHFGSPWPGLCSLTCSFRLLNLQRKVIPTLHMKLLPVIPAILSSLQSFLIKSLSILCHAVKDTTTREVFHCFQTLHAELSQISSFLMLCD